MIVFPYKKRTRHKVRLEIACTVRPRHMHRFINNFPLHNGCVHNKNMHLERTRSWKSHALAYYDFIEQEVAHLILSAFVTGDEYMIPTTIEINKNQPREPSQRLRCNQRTENCFMPKISNLSTTRYLSRILSDTAAFLNQATHVSVDEQFSCHGDSWKLLDHALSWRLLGRFARSLANRT